MLPHCGLVWHHKIRSTLFAKCRRFCSCRSVFIDFCQLTLMYIISGKAYKIIPGLSLKQYDSHFITWLLSNVNSSTKEMTISCTSNDTIKRNYLQSSPKCPWNVCTVLNQSGYLSLCSWFPGWRIISHMVLSSGNTFANAPRILNIHNVSPRTSYTLCKKYIEYVPYFMHTALLCSVVFGLCSQLQLDSCDLYSE